MLQAAPENRLASHELRRSVLVQQEKRFGKLNGALLRVRLPYVERRPVTKHLGRFLEPMHRKMSDRFNSWISLRFFPLSIICPSCNLPILLRVIML